MVRIFATATTRVSSLLLTLGSTAKGTSLNRGKKESADKEGEKRFE